MDKKDLYATAMLKSDNTWHNFTKPVCLDSFDHVEQLNKTTQRDYYFCWFDAHGKEMGILYFVKKE